MGPIEFALFSQAWRLRGSVMLECPPIKPALDCLAEAITITCHDHGMSDAETAQFLLDAASRVHDLDPEIRHRRDLRRIERRMLHLLGQRPEPNSETEM